MLAQGKRVWVCKTRDVGLTSTFNKYVPTPRAQVFENVRKCNGFNDHFARTHQLRHVLRPGIDGKVEPKVMLQGGPVPWTL